MAYLLGIDLGTSSVKTALFAASNLQVVAASDYEYDVDHPQPGYAEQEPAVWWQAVVKTLQTVLSGHDAGWSKVLALADKCMVWFVWDKMVCRFVQPSFGLIHAVVWRLHC